MRVTLIASTRLAHNAFSETDYDRHSAFPSPVTDADELAEFAGRSCYLSWERPNPVTATNAGYLSHIVKQRHFSVLEHSSATFYIEDVSRSLTHELVRHRHLSFSQLSQRFVELDAGDDPEFIIPPAIARLNDEAISVLEKAWHDAVEAYDALTEALNHLPVKQCREAARAVLPNMTPTSIVVTGNLRAWRDVIEKRSSPAADAEIRELADELLEQLTALAPSTFADMW